MTPKTNIAPGAFCLETKCATLLPVDQSKAGNMKIETPQAKWKAANQLATWAHGATRNAIRRGLLIPQPCEVCGAEKVDAHHPDHSNPLLVAWLCRLHRRRLHATERKAGAQ